MAVIKTTGIAHNIAHESGKPIIVRITKKTMTVGRNLIRATNAAEIGNMIRGKAVLRINFWPFTTDLEPPVRVFATK